MAEALAERRVRGGRIFFLGVGGSAANCSHAVNDFRKIAGIRTYTPTDNVAELTARTNDHGWRSTFTDWLIGEGLNSADLVWVFSVGGGSSTISPNISDAVQYADMIDATVWGIVGAPGGITGQYGDEVIRVNAPTPYVESIQVAILHAIVTHPALSGNRHY